MRPASCSSAGLLMPAPGYISPDLYPALDKDPAKYNQALALKDPQMSMTLDASQDPAGIKRRSNLAEIYLVRDEQKQVQEVVLPIYGNGLWSMMYANARRILRCVQRHAHLRVF